MNEEKRIYYMGLYFVEHKKPAPDNISFRELEYMYGEHQINAERQRKLSRIRAEYARKRNQRKIDQDREEFIRSRRNKSPQIVNTPPETIHHETYANIVDTLVEPDEYGGEATVADFGQHHTYFANLSNNQQFRLNPRQDTLQDIYDDYMNTMRQRIAEDTTYNSSVWISPTLSALARLFSVIGSDPSLMRSPVNESEVTYKIFTAESRNDEHIKMQLDENKCPICYEQFSTPHYTCTGSVYCFECIDTWFAEHDTDPLTNLEVHTKTTYLACELVD